VAAPQAPMIVAFVRGAAIDADASCTTVVAFRKTMTLRLTCGDAAAVAAAAAAAAAANASGSGLQVTHAAAFDAVCMLRPRVVTGAEPRRVEALEPAAQTLCNCACDCLWPSYA
jgi:hypothetical protein